MRSRQKRKTAEREGRDDLGVRLGTHWVPTTGRFSTRLDETKHSAVGRAVVETRDLIGVPAEYRSEARVEAGGRTLYLGWVAQAVSDGSQVAFELRNSLALDETRLEHLSHANMTDTEMVWALAQWAGFRPEALDIPGLAPVPEVIAVAMPVTGLDLSEDLDLSAVRLTRDRRLIEMTAEPLLKSEAKEAFLSAGVWAVARIESAFLLTAERGAVPLIEDAMDRLALEAQYSLATDPDGLPLPFQRAGLLTDPTALRTTLVHGHATGRTWLRSLDNPPIRAQVTARRLRLPDAEPSADPAWQEALRSWRRAVRATDGLAAVAALFEAVEFYAAGTRVPRVLSGDDLRRVATAVDGLGLDAAKHERLRKVLTSANHPPLLARLRAALEARGVPHSDAEMDALGRLRRHRDDAVHGSGRGEPDENDLALAVGLVNRMLVFRVWRAESRS